MDQDLNKNPAVSVMMLTYNRAKYIGAAIESVLNQSFEDWELLIVDGGSRDNTEQTIEKYLNNPKIKYLKQAQNIGITKNRNFALREACGEFVAVLDSDDVWIDSEKLRKQIEFLREHCDYVLIGTATEIIDENGRRRNTLVSPLTDEKIRSTLLLRNGFVHSSVMYRREAAISAGRYDESLFIWEDLDLFLKLGLLGKFANFPDISTAYRKHSDSSFSKKRIKGALTVIKIIKRYRKTYPNFYSAYFKAWLRVLIRAISPWRRI